FAGSESCKNNYEATYAINNNVT
mgnify:CR=1